MIYVSRKINLKNLTQNEKLILKQLCILSKDLYNLALERTLHHYSETQKTLFWQENLKSLKDTLEYKAMGYAFGSIVKEAEANFKKYLRSVQNENKYRRKWHEQNNKAINPPDKKKHYFILLSEIFKQDEKSILIPIPYDMWKKYGELRLTLTDELRSKKIKRIVISPLYNYREFRMSVSFAIEEIKTDVDMDKAIGIDLGVDNFATIVSSEGDSFILDGKYLKSTIQGYEKYMAKIKSTKHNQGLKDYTKKQIHLMNRRHNQVEDYINKCTSYIIKYCLDRKIGNVAVGYNINFSNAPNMGSANNQMFSQIPFARFVEKLEFQCKKHNICFVKLNEMYSSQASFYDNDTIPDYISSKKHLFSGKRTHRGMYIASDGRKINADVNAAANILRRGNLVSQEKVLVIQTRGIAQPMRINPLDGNS